MKLLIALCVVAAAFAVPVSDDDQYYWYEYGKFVATFRKDSDLHAASGRFNIFKANLQLINAENAKGSDAVLGVNEFADMTFEEFAQKYLGYKGVKTPAPEAHAASKAMLPDSVDWREKNAVTPVKNQGSCGSCWAFSAVASLEGAHSIKAGSLVSLSEQQLVDCSTSFGNQGCNGGLMDQAFQYLLNATAGDDTEAAYPYEGRDASCRYSKDKVGSTIASFVDVPAKDEAALADAVATVGPVSVAIHVTAGFQFYMGGVYNSFLCSSSPSSLNHGVAVVGYGTQGSKQFWTVKNSWGGSWGEKGYIRMARGKNLCGIADVASYPRV